MNSLRGQLLIAAPELKAPFFTRTVILMIDHNEEGAMGVILNRPTEAKASELPREVVGPDFDWDKPLNLGGPVPGPLMILHTLSELADREVLPGLFLTLDAEKAREILDGRSEPSLLVVNYAGWGAGQLEGEFGWDSWLTVPASIEHIFGAAEEDLWIATVRQANARKLSEFLGLRVIPTDPSLN